MSVTFKANKIVALRGKGDRGKTTTLKKVITILEQKYSFKRIKIGKNSTDEYSVGTIKGKKVAIITAGDDIDALDRYISRVAIINQQVDILVIACHEGQTSKHLYNYSEDIVFIQNAYIDNELYDANKAERLHSLIAQFIYDNYMS